MPGFISYLFDMYVGSASRWKNPLFIFHSWKKISRRADLRDLWWTTNIHLSILISSMLPELQSLTFFFFFWLLLKISLWDTSLEAIFFPISTWHIKAPFHLLLWIVPPFPLFCSLLWDVCIIYDWLSIEPESNLNSGDI